MPIADCQETVAHSRIKIEELGKKAIFINDERKEYVRTKVDGCVLVNTTAADWVLSKSNVGDVIVELKGADVAHAAEQVHATAHYWKDNSLCIGKLAGLIVCTQYPRGANTKIQKAQQAFSRKFKGPLHVFTGNREYLFESVLSFDPK
ncbi:MAG: hypothetical protein ACLPX9_06375 [Rhodomicrobium sp.]